MKRTITKHLLTGVMLSAHKETIPDGPEKAQIVTMLTIEDPEEATSYVIPLRSDVRDALVEQLTGGIAVASESEIAHIKGGKIL